MARAGHQAEQGQSAAATESLKGQAQQLVQAVVVFKATAAQSSSAATPLVVPTLTAEAATAKTGADGEWTSF